MPEPRNPQDLPSNLFKDPEVQDGAILKTVHALREDGGATVQEASRRLREAVGRPGSLYAIVDMLKDLVARVEAEEGELTPELERELDQLEGDFETKVRRTGAVLWRLEQERDEQEKLYRMVKARRDRAKRLYESLSGYLGRQLHRAGVDVVGAVDGVECTWSAKESTTTVVPQHYYEDPSRLPGITYEPVTGYSIDRRAVRKILDEADKLRAAGKPVPPELQLPEGIEIKRTYTAKVT